MRESQGTLFQPDFNRSIHVETRREAVSADGGALVLRELLYRLGLDEWLSEELSDPRDPDRIVHPTEELLRTLVGVLGRRTPILNGGWVHEDANGVHIFSGMRPWQTRELAGKVVPADPRLHSHAVLVTPTGRIRPAYEYPDRLSWGPAGGDEYYRLSISWPEGYRWDG